MKVVTRLAAMLLIAIVAGCSNKNIDTTKLQNAFPSNEGGSQDLIAQGVDAISKTNYPAALDTLEKLAYRPHLTKEQRQILEEVIDKLKDRVRNSH
jgi:outer membrane protein assembly factor BamD (BamD/ComL family)